MKLPKGIKQKNNDNYISYDNRGMSLEEDLNLTNKFYITNNIAFIYKKPTPIQIVKTKNKIITEAFFKEPSTTDYNGLYNGKYIDYEAKETNNASFPISNIHNHQIKHLQNIFDHGGISFIVVRFNKYNETFILSTKYLLEIIDQNKKSIPYSFFKKYGNLVELNYQPRLDYLKVIEQMEDIYENTKK